jgi:cardiolipin synthase
MVTDRVLTVPNLLSMLRLAMVPVFGVLIVRGWDGPAILVLAVSGATDWLDGVLARRLAQVSRLGQILDPLADRLFILATLFGLAYREVIPVWLVLVLLLRDLVMVVTVVVLAWYGHRPLPVHFVGKAATFNLLYAFPLLLLGDGQSLVAVVARVCGWAFAWWGTGLYWYAGVLYLWQVGQVVRRIHVERAAECGKTGHVRGTR